MNRAAMNTCFLCSCLCTHFDGYKPRSGNVASMNVQLQELLTVFQGGYTNLPH